MNERIVLADIVERVRSMTTMDIDASPQFFQSIAMTEERTQFEDDRSAARKEIRKLIEAEARRIQLGQAAGGCGAD